MGPGPARIAESLPKHGPDHATKRVHLIARNADDLCRAMFRDCAGGEIGDEPEPGITRRCRERPVDHPRQILHVGASGRCPSVPAPVSCSIAIWCHRRPHKAIEDQFGSSTSGSNDAKRRAWSGSTPGRALSPGVRRARWMAGPDVSTSRNDPLSMTIEFISRCSRATPPRYATRRPLRVRGNGVAASVWSWGSDGAGGHSGSAVSGRVAPQRVRCSRRLTRKKDGRSGFLDRQKWLSEHSVLRIPDRCAWAPGARTSSQYIHRYLPASARLHPERVHPPRPT